MGDFYRSLILVGLMAAMSSQILWAAESYSVDTGTTREVDEWGVCERVVNSSGSSIFIPTKTDPEWLAFRTNLPSGVTLAACTCPAVSHRDSSTATSTTDTIVIPKPIGLAVNDVMVAHIAHRGANTGTTLEVPTGWTKLGSDSMMGSGGGSNSQRSAAYYKVATAGDVAATDFTWSFAGATNSIGAIQAYSNVEVDNPVDDSSSMTGTSNISTIDATAVTTNYTNAMIVAVFAENGSLTYTPDAAYSERYDFANGTQISAMGSDAILAAAGSSGTVTATLSGNGNRRTGKLVALRKNTLNCP